MTLLPRKPKVQQGTTAAPVKTPAEDWRLSEGGLWAPGGVSFQERAGVVAGAAPNGATEPLQVTAAAGGVFTIYPGRYLVQGSAALQGAYVGVIDQNTTRTIAGSDLPAAGSYKAGYLGIRVYDQNYTDAQDGADVIYVLGASASSAGAAAYPPMPPSFLQLRAFTVDSSGAVTFGSYLPPFTVPRGGMLPTRVGDTTSGVWVGQARDLPGDGFSRWDGTLWNSPKVTSIVPNAAIGDIVTNGTLNSITRTNMTPGRRYEIVYQGHISSTVAGDRLTTSIRTGSPTGPILAIGGEYNLLAVVSSAYVITRTHTAFDVATSTTQTYYVTFSRSGTGACTQQVIAGDGGFFLVRPA